MKVLLSVLSFIWFQSVISDGGDEKIAGSGYPYLGGFTYAISIQIKPSQAQHCVGSLWTNRHVLSTCSCTFIQSVNDSAIFYTLTAGVEGPFGKSRFVEDSSIGQRRNVHRIIRHPLCTIQKIFDYDYAFFEADKPFSLGEKVSLSPLVSQNYITIRDRLDAIISGNQKVCKTIGWGQVYPSDDSYQYSDVLMVGMVESYPLDKCLAQLCSMSKEFCSHHNGGKSLVCFRGLGTVKICDGDQGAPLLCNGNVYGVLSWLPECGSRFANLPAVFHRIDSVEPFMTSAPKSIGHLLSANFYFLITKMFLEII